MVVALGDQSRSALYSVSVNSEALRMRRLLRRWVRSLNTNDGSATVVKCLV